MSIKIPRFLKSTVDAILEIIQQLVELLEK